VSDTTAHGECSANYVDSTFPTCLECRRHVEEYRQAVLEAARLHARVAELEAERDRTEAALREWCRFASGEARSCRKQHTQVRHAFFEFAAKAHEKDIWRARILGLWRDVTDKEKTDAK